MMPEIKNPEIKSKEKTMVNTIRIAIVSHACVVPENRIRWQRLAEQHPDTEVSVFVPSFWEGHQYSQVEQWFPQTEVNSNYRVIPVPVLRRKAESFLFLSTGFFLKRLEPEIIHVAEGEFALVWRQIMLYRRLWNLKAKLLFMSYNNSGIPIEQFYPRLIWRWVCHDSDIAVAGNSKVRSIWEEVGYPKPIIEQTEIGVDENLFCPDKMDRKFQRQRLDLEGTIVIGFAGRIMAYKGVMELTDAVLRLSGDWSLLMVGSGDQQKEIQARFDAAGQSNRLRMIGLIPRSEMPHYLRAMDIFVLPSRKSWNEQFGLVLPEAMMCGLPVVGSTSGAIPEVIGNAGKVFPSDDTEALHAILQSLITNENMRILLAKQGRERALRHYSCGVLADDIYSVYRSLLMNKKTGNE